MICYLDLDGVLVDLYAHAHKPNDLKPLASWPAGEYNIARAYGYCDSDFWPNMDWAAFWEQLPWTSDGKLILNLCENAFDDVCIVSRPCGPNCAAGKIRWIEKNLRGYYRQGDYLIGPGKKHLGHPGAALVDDSDKNVIEFIQKGGKGILVPRRWNSAHHISDPIRALKVHFESFNEEETRSVPKSRPNRRKRS